MELLEIKRLRSLNDNDTISSPEHATYIVITHEPQSVAVQTLYYSHATETLVAEHTGEISTYPIQSTTADSVRALLDSEQVQTLLAQTLQGDPNSSLQLATILNPSYQPDKVSRLETADDFDTYCDYRPLEWLTLIGAQDKTWADTLQLVKNTYTRKVEGSTDDVWLPGDHSLIADTHDITWYLHDHANR